MSTNQQPNWQPIEQLAILNPKIDPTLFMYMGKARTHGGEEIELYKHVNTRAYLNLRLLGGDQAGTHGATVKCFKFSGSDYTAIPELEAVARALRLSTEPTFSPSDDRDQT